MELLGIGKNMLSMHNNQLPQGKVRINNGENISATTEVLSYILPDENESKQTDQYRFSNQHQCNLQYYVFTLTIICYPQALTGPKS